MPEFEAGALDLALQPTLNDWVRVQKEAKSRALINQNSGNYMGAAFNTSQPTNNMLVRQALQFALDRQRVADTVFQSVEKQLTLLWYPTSPAYDAAKNQKYAIDLDKARALLAQANASSVALDFNYPSTFPDFGRVGQIWQARSANSTTVLPWARVSTDTITWRSGLDVAVFRTSQQLRRLQG